VCVCVYIHTHTHTHTHTQRRLSLFSTSLFNCLWMPWVHGY